MKTQILLLLAITNAKKDSKSRRQLEQELQKHKNGSIFMLFCVLIVSGGVLYMVHLLCSTDKSNRKIIKAKEADIDKGIDFMNKLVARVKENDQTIKECNFAIRCQNEGYKEYQRRFGELPKEVIEECIQRARQAKD